MSHKDDGVIFVITVIVITIVIGLCSLFCMYDQDFCNVPAELGLKSVLYRSGSIYSDLCTCVELHTAVYVSR